MSGIPVYTSSPIKASKPTATTPQTVNPEALHSPLVPNPASATTTASVSSTSCPPARTDMKAFPTPTSAAQPLYAPIRPTPTAKTDSEPPAPQPGAIPTPFEKSAVPPPPKLGENYHPQQTEAPAPSSTYSYPPQMAYSPPTTTYDPQTSSSSTSAANIPSVPCPVAIPPGESLRRSLEHPPGYHQNVYTSELTSDQRRAQQTEQATNFSGMGTRDTGNAGGYDPEGVWNAAKKWAQTAGEKISVAEAEMWKKINKE
ncbi:hypothetical protein ONS95_014856 [Cadophora gregata]|uniref:uncharacterized protein n=1 Tax=Cadophora gregata TaxID=51156 RepID=UPI0026DB3A6C|nr:uncharacterized protein ONS95_014856 [Cadophora gregata]KAK0113157.1 hypothetical protein ONS95_014856 [Cadophora gregata]KAK0125198.1 hypothetical protein ONS96_009057 [Cadophora gregata f. sp. sojae]